MSVKDTSHRDRVSQAIRFTRPDRTPRDFAAVPEVWERLALRLGAADREEVLQALGIDLRIVSYDSFCSHPDIGQDQVNMEASRERSSTGGMWRAIEPDGSNRDIWGAHRRGVRNAFGTLDELVSYPLGSASTLDDLRRHRWPEPEWWDFSHLRTVIGRLNGHAVHSIRYRIGSVFETAWSLYGLERLLTELATEPGKPMYVMERIAEVHQENLRRVLEIAADLIDIVYFYDDLASQNGLLLHPRLYDRCIRPFHQGLIDMARSFGKHAMLHSCGSVYALIPRLIDMGLDILNPVQPSARNMSPEKLAKEFGGRIAFHGGVDVQQFLPRATPAQVREEVRRISELLGARGGYVRAGSHHLQADTPLDNILEMYLSD